MANDRLLPSESIPESEREEFLDALRGASAGSPLDPDTELASLLPLVNPTDQAQLKNLLKELLGHADSH